MNKVAISDMFEIQSSQLAQADADTKPFAEKIVQDHQKTSSELKALVDGGKDATENICTSGVRCLPSEVIIFTPKRLKQLPEPSGKECGHVGRNLYAATGSCCTDGQGSGDQFVSVRPRLIAGSEGVLTARLFCLFQLLPTPFRRPSSSEIVP